MPKVMMGHNLLLIVNVVLCEYSHLEYFDRLVAITDIPHILLLPVNFLLMFAYILYTTCPCSKETSLTINVHQYQAQNNFEI